MIFWVVKLHTGDGTSDPVVLQLHQDFLLIAVSIRLPLISSSWSNDMQHDFGRPDGFSYFFNGVPEFSAARSEFPNMMSFIPNFKSNSGDKQIGAQV